VISTIGIGVGVDTTAQQGDQQREPEAVAALKKMGAYLRSLKAFQVDAVTTREDVLTDGEKVQFTGVAKLLARVPDRLRLDVVSDRRDRQFIYDGKTFTLFARRSNFYATVAAPPTIGELADTLEARYGIDLPLVDLFRWGSPESKDNIVSAMFVGPSEVGGVTCAQYAYRQEGLDWQVWIQMGDYPLPRKLVLTTMTDPARPQYVATFTWNLAPSYNDATFTFVPPTGAGRVVLADLTKDGGPSNVQ
jgi:hypothetical protein